MPYSMPTREGDVIHTVRKIARMSQVVSELRDDYERRPRRDTLGYLEERLGELCAMREELRARIVALDSREGLAAE